MTGSLLAGLAPGGLHTLSVRQSSLPTGWPKVSALAAPQAGGTASADTPAPSPEASGAVSYDFAPVAGGARADNAAQGLEAQWNDGSLHVSGLSGCTSTSQMKAAPALAAASTPTVEDDTPTVALPETVAVLPEPSGLAQVQTAALAGDAGAMATTPGAPLPPPAQPGATLPASH